MSNESASMRIAVCFFLAKPHHRIPHRPLHRYWLGRARRFVRRLRGAPPTPRDFDFTPGLEAAIASLHAHGSAVPPVLLLTPDRISKPKGVDRVIRISLRSFDGVRKVGWQFGATSLHKLALFSLRGYDRLVYFDADTLAVDDVSELWDPARYRERDLYAVREKLEGGAAPDAAGGFNAGVLVVNAPMLDGRAFSAMTGMAPRIDCRDHSDQAILNAYLADETCPFTIGELDPSFNLFVNDSNYESGLLARAPARLYHFVGANKPWTTIPDFGERHHVVFREMWHRLVRENANSR